MRILLAFAFWGWVCGVPEHMHTPEHPNLASAKSAALAGTKLGRTPLVLHLNFTRRVPLTHVQQTAFLVALEHRLGIAATGMRAWPGHAEILVPASPILYVLPV